VLREHENEKIVYGEMDLLAARGQRQQKLQTRFRILIRTTATCFGIYQPFFSPFRGFSLKYNLSNAFERSVHFLL